MSIYLFRYLYSQLIALARTQCHFCRYLFMSYNHYSDTSATS
nr:MAG TPA: TM Leucine-rich repeat family 19 TM domain [Caudoviricetes sp.]